MKKVSVTYCFIILFLTVFSQNSNPFEVVRDEVSATKPIQTNTELNSHELLDDKEFVSPYQNPFSIDTVRHLFESPSSHSIIENLKDPSRDFTRQNNTSDSFIFIMILLSLLILTVSIVRDRKAFKSLYKLISNQNYLKLVNRDINGGKMVFFILLYVLFFICFSLFVYHYVSQNYNAGGVSIFIAIFAFITGTYCVKHLSLFGLGKITLTSKLISHYNFLIIVTNSICGILLFPIVILLNYSGLSQIIFYIGLICIIICYITRQFNGTPNLFHFFIYICTFEIAPAMIILKLIQEYAAGM